MSKSTAPLLGSVRFGEDEDQSPAPIPAVPPKDRHDRWADRAREEATARVATPPIVAAAPTLSVVHTAGTPPLSVYQEGEDCPVGTLLLIPLSLIDRSKYNPRVFQLQEDMEALREAIAFDGQQAAIQVVFDPATKRFVAKDGHRRVQCLNDLQKPYAKAEVVERKEPVIEWRESRELNSKHTAQTHFDDIKQVKMLLEESGLSQQDFAAKARMRPAELSKFLRMGTLPDDLIEEMAPYPLKFNAEMVFQMAMMLKTATEADVAIDRIRRLIERVKEGEKFTSKMMRDIAAGVNEKDADVDARPMERRHFRTHTVFNGKVEGSLKVWDQKLKLEVGNIQPGQEEAFAEALKAVCHKFGGSSTNQPATKKK